MARLLCKDVFETTGYSNLLEGEGQNRGTEGEGVGAIPGGRLAFPNFRREVFVMCHTNVSAIKKRSRETITRCC